jgi:MoxR-like ATPase
MSAAPVVDAPQAAQQPLSTLATIGVAAATHLLWMLKKDTAGQDMFLLGPPGPLRRRLALMYAELMRREVESLVVSRDTTESDLKQRRELAAGSVYFVDAAPVRAAMHGRLLVVEGIERAERNILPLLNNLLENREMALEDGRFLVSPARWEQLMAGPQADAVRREGRLVPVHPRFRVLMVGTPVPPYPGRPLDPPLRSRFSARFIPHPDPTHLSAALAAAQAGESGLSGASAAGGGELASSLSTDLSAFAASMHLLEAASQGLLSTGSGTSGAAKAPGGLVSPAAAERALSGRGALNAAAAAMGSGLAGRVPPFPAASLPSVLPLLQPLLSPTAGTDGAPLYESLADALHAVYPFLLMPELCTAGHAAGGGSSAAGPASSQKRHPGGRDPYRAPVGGAKPSAAKRDVPDRFSALSPTFASVLAPLASQPLRAEPSAADTVASAAGGGAAAAAVAAGIGGSPAAGFVSVPCLELLVRRGVASLSQAQRDILLVGPAGAGKSAAAREIARRLQRCWGAASAEAVEESPCGAGEAAGEAAARDCTPCPQPLLFPLYADMTARDLFQRRDTDPRDGSSRWADSPLIEAAVTGHTVILDGVERLPGETLAVLARLLADREVDLPDGRRLVAGFRYAGEEVAEPAPALPEGGTGAAAGSAERLQRVAVHPHFRVIALASVSNAAHVASWERTARALYPPPAPAAGAIHADGKGAAGSAAAAATGIPSAGQPLPFLHPEVLPLFHYHVLPELSVAEEAAVLHTHAPGLPRDLLLQLAQLGRSLRDAAAAQFADDAATAATLRLTLRHLVRVARMMRSAAAAAGAADAAPGSGSVGELAAETTKSAAGAGFAGTRRGTGDGTAAPVVSPGAISTARAAARAEVLEAVFVHVLPADAQALVRRQLDAHGFTRAPGAAAAGAGEYPGGSSTAAAGDAAPAIRVSEGRLHIGDVSMRLSEPARPELVPSTLFHAIPRHVAYLRDMAFDWQAGERHLLLVGNQGTGKNKLVDALLQLARREREYVQLHRDSTVSSITITPTITDGRVVWEDSPLVRAARYGRVLVVDELDKAPGEVTAVLKSLVEDGYLALGDGRRLVGARAGERVESGAPHSASGASTAADGNAAGATAAVDAVTSLQSGHHHLDIPIHPDFAVICLANRPGWPFLGNNVLTSGLAPCFSCHWIDNPDAASELQLLRGYAPGVPSGVLRSLCEAFAELRGLHDAGVLAYPYSTRESVAVARHLQAFPQDPAAAALENVLAFDCLDASVRGLLADTFARHGLAVSLGAAAAAADAILNGPATGSSGSSSGGGGLGFVLSSGAGEGAAAAAAVEALTAEHGSDIAALAEALEAAALRAPLEAALAGPPTVPVSAETATPAAAVGSASSRSAPAARGLHGRRHFSTLARWPGSPPVHALSLARARFFSASAGVGASLLNQALSTLRSVAGSGGPEAAAADEASQARPVGAERLPAFTADVRTRVWTPEPGFFNPPPPPAHPPAASSSSSTPAGAGSGSDEPVGAPDSEHASPSVARAPEPPFPVLSPRLQAFGLEKSRFSIIDGSEQARQRGAGAGSSSGAAALSCTVAGSSFWRPGARADAAHGSAAAAGSGAADGGQLFVLTQHPLRLYGFRGLVEGGCDSGSEAAAGPSSTSAPADAPRLAAPVATPHAQHACRVAESHESSEGQVAGMLGALPQRSYTMLDLQLALRVPWAMGGLGGFAAAAGGGFFRAGAGGWGMAGSADLTQALRDRALAAAETVPPTGSVNQPGSGHSWQQPFAIAVPGGAPAAPTEAVDASAPAVATLTLQQGSGSDQAVALPLVAVLLPELQALLLGSPLSGAAGTLLAQLPDVPLVRAAAAAATTAGAGDGAGAPAAASSGRWHMLSLPCAPLAHGNAAGAVAAGTSGGVVIWREGGAAVAHLTVHAPAPRGGARGGLSSDAAPAWPPRHAAVQMQLLPLPAQCIAAGGSSHCAVSASPDGIIISDGSNSGQWLLRPEVTTGATEGGWVAHPITPSGHLASRRHLLPHLGRAVEEVSELGGAAAGGSADDTADYATLVEARVQPAAERGLPTDSKAPETGATLPVPLLRLPWAASAPAGSQGSTASPASTRSHPPLFVGLHDCGNGSGDVLVIQRDGVIRILQLSPPALARDLRLWARINGVAPDATRAVAAGVGISVNAPATVPGAGADELSQGVAADGNTFRGLGDSNGVLTAGSDAAPEPRSLIDVVVASPGEELQVRRSLHESLLAKARAHLPASSAALGAAADGAPMLRLKRAFAAADPPAGAEGTGASADDGAAAGEFLEAHRSGGAGGPRTGAAGGAAAGAQLRAVGTLEAPDQHLVTSLAAHQKPGVGAARSKALAAALNPATKKPPPVQAPKRGKVDTTGAPHVGGNTWAGGSGGSETAGLGGRGGPFRLDSGNPVHQLSDEEKADVPRDVRERARQMAAEALEARMREIDMTAGEATRYRGIVARVGREIAQLRAVLEASAATSKERVWLRHQAVGDLDDGKLVDALTGDKHVFKRRAEREEADPFLATAPPKPRYLLFLVDVSGSMYRFNGVDGRLDRQLEVVALIMEAFAGQANRFRYALVGHSGDGPWVPFSTYAAPPANEKERHTVLERMAAHTQFCDSGDHTLQAAVRGVRDLAGQTDAAEEDGRYLFLLSDANLPRYGIQPTHVATALTANPAVQGYAVFLSAGLGDGEAEYLIRALPPRRGFSLGDSSELPGLFKGIFARRFGGTG